MMDHFYTTAIHASIHTSVVSSTYIWIYLQKSELLVPAVCRRWCLSLSPVFCFPTSVWSLEWLWAAGPPPQCCSPAVQLSLSASLPDQCVSACARGEISCAITCMCWSLLVGDAYGAAERAIASSLRLCMIAMHQRPCQWCVLMGFGVNFHIIM